MRGNFIHTRPLRHPKRVMQYLLQGFLLLLPLIFFFLQPLPVKAVLQSEDVRTNTVSIAPGTCVSVLIPDCTDLLIPGMMAIELLEEEDSFHDEDPDNYVLFSSGTDHASLELFHHQLSHSLLRQYRTSKQVVPLFVLHHSWKTHLS